MTESDPNDARRAEIEAILKRKLGTATVEDHEYPVYSR